MTGTILVLNGPNLNLLGSREPEIYGKLTLSDIEQLSRQTGNDLGLTVECVQSNHEGELIETLHHARTMVDGVVINAGGYSHTSVALRDAVSALPQPTVEVHLTNLFAREEFRHQSYISPVVNAVIVGAGADGYSLAIEHLATLLQK